MIVRSIENCLRRVEPQPVKMILVDPLTRIGDKEFSGRSSIGPVEVGVKINDDLFETLLRQSSDGDIGRVRPIDRDAELRQDLNQRFR